MWEAMKPMVEAEQKKVLQELEEIQAKERCVP